jgi:hypothetical protein
MTASDWVRSVGLGRPDDGGRRYLTLADVRGDRPRLAGSSTSPLATRLFRCSVGFSLKIAVRRVGRLDQLLQLFQPRQLPVVLLLGDPRLFVDSARRLRAVEEGIRRLATRADRHAGGAHRARTSPIRRSHVPLLQHRAHLAARGQVLWACLHLDHKVASALTC